MTAKLDQKSMFSLHELLPDVEIIEPNLYESPETTKHIYFLFFFISKVTKRNPIIILPQLYMYTIL